MLETHIKRNVHPRRYLEMAFSGDSGIRSQDSSRVFSSVARNDVGRSVAWDYLRQNWNTIYG